jgi:hypothetical protein
VVTMVAVCEAMAVKWRAGKAEQEACDGYDMKMEMEGANGGAVDRKCSCQLTSSAGAAVASSQKRTVCGCSAS